MTWVLRLRRLTVVVPLEHSIVFGEVFENTRTTYDPFLTGLDDGRSLIYDQLMHSR